METFQKMKNITNQPPYIIGEKIDARSWVPCVRAIGSWQFTKI